MDTGLKIDLGTTKKQTVLFNLTKEFYPTQTSLSRNKSLGQHFVHNFASFQVNKCPIYGQMETGLNIDLRQQCNGQYSLTSLKNCTQPNHPLQEKISLNQHFFHNFALFQVNKCPIYEQMETGLKIDFRQQSSGQYSLTSR